MFDLNPLIGLYEHLEKYLSYQLTQIKLEKYNLVNAIIEMPMGCAYKLDYNKGVYWVSRPLEEYRRLPISYGFIENIMGENRKELDAMIYIPPNVNHEFINTSEIGFKCIAICGLQGNSVKIIDNRMNIVCKEYKILVVPEIFLQSVLKDVDSLVSTLSSVIYSLHTNYIKRIKNETAFKMTDIMDYVKTNNVLESLNIDKY